MLKRIESLEKEVSGLKGRQDKTEEQVIDTIIEMRQLRSRFDALSQSLKCDLRNVEQIKKLSEEQLDLIEGIVQLGTECRVRGEKRSLLLIFGLKPIDKEYEILKAACAQARLPPLFSSHLFGRANTDTQGAAIPRPVRLTFRGVVSKMALTNCKRRKTF